jgi:hypothetical protein
VLQNTDWNTLDSLYKNSHGNYDDILAYSNGLKYLKIRTISKGHRIKAFGRFKKIHRASSMTVGTLLPLLFEKSTEKEIEDFINSTYNSEREGEKDKEKEIYSELLKIKTVDWGGVYGNDLEKHIVSIVKQNPNHSTMIQKIQNDVIPAVEGWAMSNWYSFWSNDVIENIIKDHSRILPGIGDIKHIDFFWDNIPMDLKSSKFATGYIETKRKEMKLKKELAVLKTFAREKGVTFDTNNTDTVIKNEIIENITNSQNDLWKKFLKEKIFDVRKNILNDAIKNPKDYVHWLYTNQGENRFGNENRFFLILVNTETTDASWKLKRETEFVRKKIYEFLDEGIESQIIKDIHFSYNGEKFVSHCCILFIIEE